MKELLSLGGAWALRGTSPDGETINLDAKVPGCALNDIRHSNYAENEDIFYRDNANAYLKYENYDWVYSKSFSVDSVPPHPVLVFERLDTYSDVYLNGVHLGHRENGNIRQVFTCGDALKLGVNLLEVYLYSPVNAVRGRKSASGAFTTERLRTRRMQCTYGWDWTMRFLTCGMTRDVGLFVEDDKVEVKGVYVYTKVIDEDGAEIGADITLDLRDGGQLLDFVITDPHGKVVRRIEKYCEEPFVRLDVCLVDPHIWYPVGYGEQPLYHFAVNYGDSELYSTIFGIRTVQILELPDEQGDENYQKCLELKKSPFSQHYDKNSEFSCFILKVNGIRIFCKGANWVPCEPFANGNTDAKITETLELAKEAGVNMLRIWGGGAFETEHFYRECSRLGILVTQDFLMACGHYPEGEEWFLEELRKEAEYAVELIRNQPCLAWWTGDNENAVEGCDTDTDYPGRKSAYKAIAPVLYQKDAYRRFLPSSPYGGKNYASNTKGTTHNTQFLGSFLPYIAESDLSDYQEYFKLYNARFIAEEPSLGAVERQSLLRMMTEDDILGEDMTQWFYHTQSNPDLEMHLLDYACRFAEKLFGKFRNGEDRLFKLQYLQSEWLRLSLERSRREKWFCSGIIYWMLNDCWPASAGWAFLDYYNRPKSSYYAFKRRAKPLAVMIDKENGQYRVYVVNDGANTEVSIRLLSVDADRCTTNDLDSFSVNANANQSSIAANIPCSMIQNGDILYAVMLRDGVEIDRAFYVNGLPVIEKLDNDDVWITAWDNESVTLTAYKYVHAVRIESEGVADDNYFSMFPGETRKIRIKGYSESNDERAVVGYTLL